MLSHLSPILIFLTSAWPSFILVLSPQSPAYLTDVLLGQLSQRSDILRDAKMEVVNLGEFRERLAERDTSEIVVDGSFSIGISQEISRLCEECQLPHFILFPVDEAQYGKWTHAVGGSFRNNAQALKAIKMHFGFKSVNVMSDVGDFSLYFRESITDDEKIDFDATYFSLNSDATQIVGKIVRPKGNRISLFTTSANTTKEILKAQYRMHIGNVGYGNILPLVSSLYSLNEHDKEDILTNGNIVVAEEEFAGVRTASQYVTVAISRLLTYIEKHPTAEALQYQLSVDFHALDVSRVYHILNQQSGTWVFAGTITNETITTIREMRFLGNTTEAPRNSSAPLPISGNFGNTDPIEFYYPLQPMYEGAILAISDVNKRSDILPNFNIELWNFTGGYSRFNETYLQTEIMPQRDKFGAAMIASIASTINIPFLWLLKAYNDTTPVIGSATTFIDLSSKKEYPYFLRTCTSDDFLNVIIIQIFKRFGWQKCGIVIEDIFSSGAGFQARFQTLMSDSGITIANDPKYQILPSNVSSVSEAVAAYSESLRNFIDTRVRILLVISAYVGKFIPVVLYELGLRRGDAIIVTREWLDNYAFVTLSDEDIVKAGEVMTGALQFSPDRFVGAVGQKVRTTFEEKYGRMPSTFSCLYYDSAFTIAVALDWLVSSGRDYMNHTVMMTALRQSRFAGCSGIVSFESNSNDRNQVRFVLETIVFNGITPSMQRIGLYDPHGMVLLSINSNYTWPDGTTNVPKDTRVSTIDCPFEDRLKTEFPMGQNVLIGICIVAVTVTVAACTALWIFLRNRPLELLTQSKEIEIEDTLVILSVFIEFLQLLSLGPSLHYINHTLQLVLDGFIWNGEQLLSLKDGGFEKLWIFAEGTIAFWLFSIISVYARRNHRQDYSFRILELSSYLIETWLFIPLLSVLMDSFVCRNGVASVSETVTFQDSFLEADCYMVCWRGAHILLVAFSILSIVIFVPLAALQGTLWQEAQSNLHIKWSVGYVMVRTTVSVSLIALWKIEKDKDRVVHSGCFIAILLAYVGYCVHARCFGYARTRFWHVIALSAVLYTSMVSTAEIIANDSSKSLIFSCLTAVGCGFSVVFGLIYQRFKIRSLLYRPEGVNTLYLFKFAFQRANEEIVSELQSEFHRVAHSRSLVRLRTKPLQRVTTTAVAQYSSEHNM